jgi:putative Ca2+/H+ antiporter (TMEM165/GDT1 family)
MLIANVPAVYLGEKLAHKIPMKLVHSIAAVIFAVLGVATLLGVDSIVGLDMHF